MCLCVNEFSGVQEAFWPDVVSYATWMTVDIVAWEFSIRPINLAATGAACFM